MKVRVRKLSRPTGLRALVIALVSIAATFGGGWGVISAVNALETAECGPYGYGGYCPPPSISVDPSVDLVDGQIVRVRGRGFSPSTSFGAAQCDPAVGGIEGCDISQPVLTSTDAKGQVRFSMPLRRIITIQGVKRDCARLPCVLAGATLEGTTPLEAATAPITFDPRVPPLPTLKVQVAVTEVTPTGMSGTVVCARAATAYIDGSVVQRITGTPATAYGYTRNVGCDTTPTTWSMRFAYRDGRLVAGSARYQVFASANDELDYAYASRSGSTTIIVPG